MLYIYSLGPHSEHQNNPFQSKWSKHFHQRNHFIQCENGFNKVITFKSWIQCNSPYPCVIRAQLFPLTSKRTIHHATCFIVYVWLLPWYLLHEHSFPFRAYKTQWMLMYFFAGCFWISPHHVWWPNSRFWCCVFLTLLIILMCCFYARWLPFWNACLHFFKCCLSISICICASIHCHVWWANLGP